MVLPDYQGKGIGTKIMKFILKKCRNHKIRMVVLMSAKGKAEFYRRLGFKERDLNAPGMILVEK
ncbi:GNAT family N-acetyltransferase [Pseudalkalibacillus berkeleyi]|uniref:GNAT family N-acetyltransferase n=1 Tax=Pseudalkalibacillus berkeleyi TaxID=1069813 RepID=UPI002E3241DF|nr:GNAT family N-acetyltransferase [Pseudalkalibacillus berkeleyi]